MQDEIGYGTIRVAGVGIYSLLSAEMEKVKGVSMPIVSEFTENLAESGLQGVELMAALKAAMDKYDMKWPC